MKKIYQLVIVAYVFTAIISCSTEPTSIDSGGVTPPVTATDTEQQKVFKEFWGIYDRYFPLMHRKGITWQSVYDTHYPTITASTTDAQLFSIFKTIMDNPIKDGHSSVTFGDEPYSYKEPSNTEISTTVQTITDTKIDYLAGSDINDYISYGTLISNPDIGYIKSKTFEPVNELDTEFTIYQRNVDDALIALKDKKGIIVDVRTNGGGQLPYATYLAGRFFTDASIVLQRKRYKTAVGDGLSSLSPWVTTDSFGGYADERSDGGTVGSVASDENNVTRLGPFQFTKKVAVLTSRDTASSGEFFTATMKSQSHVRTIGNLTFGIFAGSEIFTLKEGAGKWQTRVSVHDIEIMYNGSFQSFEGVGITPDDLVLPTANDISAGKDVHIDKAITYINN